MTSLTDPAVAPRHESMATLRYFPVPKLDVGRLDQAYLCHTFSPENKLYLQENAVTALRVDCGTLRVDDWPILHPEISHRHISWCQQTSDRFCSGLLTFERGHTELHGIIHTGTTESDAVAHHVVATTIRAIDYQTRITRSRVPVDGAPDTLPADGWRTGLPLRIGYEQQPGQAVPQPYVELDGQDITSMTSWTIDGTTQQTVLLLNLDSAVVCSLAPDLYLQARVAFDQRVPLPTMSGTVSATCADPRGTGCYLWTGTTGAAAPEATYAVLSAPPSMVSAETLVADPALSIAELMSIVPDDRVTQQANSMVIENMKWAMGRRDKERGWLSEFFGELPPALSKSRQDLATKSLDWYQNHFAKSYLSSSLSSYAGPQAPSVRFSDSQKVKLNDFLKTGIAKDPDFSVQQNGVFLEAFTLAKPRLAAYIADDGEKWANELYAVITSPAQLILMVNRIWGAAGQAGTMEPANNFATVLSALQGVKGGLAGDYMHRLMAATLSHSAHQTTWTDTATVMQWLPDFLQTLLTQIATDGKTPDEARLLAQQIKTLQAQLGGSLTRVATQLATLVINANGANILEKTKNAESALLQKWPKLGALANGLFFMAWCGGIFMTIKAFQNWSNLTPKDKAKAILTTVELGLSAIDVLPSVLGGVKNMGLKGWNAFQEWRSGAQAIGDVADLGATVDGVGGDWIKTGARETEPLFDAVNGEVRTAGTLWETLFRGAQKVVGVIGIAISAAFAVLSTIDFVNDIESGKPIEKTIIDGIMAAANIGMTVCLVLDLFVATTVFAMAAAVLAVVGIVVAIIALFVIKPENPLDDFMRDVAIPFVDGLPAQDPPPRPGSQTFRLALA